MGGLSLPKLVWAQYGHPLGDQLILAVSMQSHVEPNNVKLAGTKTEASVRSGVHRVIQPLWLS